MWMPLNLLQNQYALSLLNDLYYTLTRPLSEDPIYQGTTMTAQEGRKGTCYAKSRYRKRPKCYDYNPYVSHL